MVLSLVLFSLFRLLWKGLAGMGLVGIISLPLDLSLLGLAGIGLPGVGLGAGLIGMWPLLVWLAFLRLLKKCLGGIGLTGIRPKEFDGSGSR